MGLGVNYVVNYLFHYCYAYLVILSLTQVATSWEYALAGDNGGLTLLNNF